MRLRWHVADLRHLTARAFALAGGERVDQVHQERRGTRRGAEVSAVAFCTVTVARWGRGSPMTAKASVADAEHGEQRERDEVPARHGPR